MINIAMWPQLVKETFTINNQCFTLFNILSALHTTLNFLGLK